MSRKLLTLVFVQDGERILLGMKKRGFGAGRYNGFGGKVHEGETIEAAAKRETLEECGLQLSELEAVGVHEFEFAHDPGNILEVHVFRAVSWSGEPVETEEMKPKWFSTNSIPYETMWPDDILWFPLFLEGKKFRAYFLFGEGDQVQKHQITVLPEEKKD